MPDDITQAIVETQDEETNRFAQPIRGEAQLEPKGIETRDGHRFSMADVRHNMIVMVMIDAIWTIGATDLVMAISPLYAYLSMPLRS